MNRLRRGEEPATKNDLEQQKNDILASRKEDLKQAVAELATKKELREMGNRFDARMSRIELAVVDIQSRMSEFVTKVEFNQKCDYVIGILEGLAARMDNDRVERAAILHSLASHDRQLLDHERRISRLQS